MRLMSLISVAVIAVALFGCERISKPYIMTVDRVDQKVQGNRGYLKGTPPPLKERTNLTRPLIAVDMDLVEIKGKPAQETTIVTKNQANPATTTTTSETVASTTAAQEQIK
jgi:hypothetical protein